MREKQNLLKESVLRKMSKTRNEDHMLENFANEIDNNMIMPRISETIPIR